MGWMQLERYIQVKNTSTCKIYSDPRWSNLIKGYPLRTSWVFFNNDVCNKSTQDFNIICDLLNAARLFNRYDEIRNMFLKDHFYRKMTWKKKVWERVWVLQDVYWRRKFKSHKSLKLLTRNDGWCRYLCWWYLSDKFPVSMFMCENLSKKSVIEIRRCSSNETDY